MSKKSKILILVIILIGILILAIIGVLGIQYLTNKKEKASQQLGIEVSVIANQATDFDSGVLPPELASFVDEAVNGAGGQPERWRNRSWRTYFEKWKIFV